MVRRKNISAPDSRAVDAVFIGWQPNCEGGVFPLFTITASGHPSYGSTVSDETLRALNLRRIRERRRPGDRRDLIRAEPADSSNPTLQVQVKNS